MPNALRQCGGALQEFQCSLPLGSEAVHCGGCTAHCPQAVWQCIARVPLLRQRPPPGQDSPSPKPVGPRIAGIPLPTAPRRCGSALHELHCPLPRRNEAVHLQELHCPLPPGSEAVRCRSSTAHCPQTMWLCKAGAPLPAAHK